MFWIENSEHDHSLIFTHSIMQNIMKMFHKAIKIRKYRRLSRNSLMLSPKTDTLIMKQQVFKHVHTDTAFNMISYKPVVGAPDSSPNPWDSFLLLQKVNIFS